MTDSKYSVDAISLTESEVRRLGKDPEVAVKLPQELGGGYMGTIEGEFQLPGDNSLERLQLQVPN